ncbi:uncharacterized protein LOC118268630 isoform X1 [Spodoptera frugiperda]|uniref:Uncharacterized protein LOC118268630 isoform X1 n=1 Tax=Spodoptera frugiperda TaxID=7108 RepID=A0A9R0D3U0_SPOFR|nr:uncharacterized protein LOC118268630 isoform X1 [Spodoptera frugiperda]
MWNRIVFCFLCFVLVCAQTGDDTDKCLEIDCVGEGYECIDGVCYCAKGYIPNHFQDKCMRCPGLGETCMGPCCNIYGNGTLSCWQGVCQPCYDDFGKWTCRESLEQILLISSTQVIMGAALILGIIATFVLLYKLCATTDMRAYGAGSNSDGRLSIGSLQLYVDERLRDAPPRYSRTPAAGSATYPAIAFLNAGFIHDSSLPPPPYTPENKTEDDRNTGTTNHI